jgi:hypothetical protein
MELIGVSVIEQNQLEGVKLKIRGHKFGSDVRGWFEKFSA